MEKISRREMLKYGIYGGLAIGLSGLVPWSAGCSGRFGHEKRPNIIFIVIDTLRADHLGCYGYARNTSPHIDRLARDGILFLNAISSAPWTTPSIGTILTSQYPSVIGIYDEPAELDPTYPLLSEILKRSGYFTYGIISHSYISAALGFGRGYDVYDEEASLVGHDGVSSPLITKKALSFLQGRAEEPFFLFLHYFDPHYDYILHPKYNYDPHYSGRVKSGMRIQAIWANRQRMSSNDIAHLRALYDSEISFTDAFVGRLLEGLEEMGQYEGSLIVLTADHGEEFMERSWIGHSITLYQELLRVPLIIKVPGARGGTIADEVGLTDVMPTLLRHLRLSLPEGIEGSPLDLDSSGLKRGRPIFSETFNPQIHRPEPVEPIALRSVIMNRRKLIYDEKKKRTQVYDLSRDPKELHDLSGENNAEHAELEALLTRWRKRMRKKEESTVAKEEDELFTPQQVENLKALGYL